MCEVCWAPVREGRSTTREEWLRARRWHEEDRWLKAQMALATTPVSTAEDQKQSVG